MVLILTSLGYSQEKVSIQLTQDAKIGLFGGYDDTNSPMLDFTVSILMQGNQQKCGYMIVYPEFEYADLREKSYRRWTANVGYVFNELFIPKLEMGASASYGFIDRGLTDFCWGANAFTKYKFNNTLKVVLNLQVTERPDLYLVYDTDRWKFSGFVGVEVSIFNQRRK